MINRFVVCAPSRLEAGALTAGMPPGSVLHIGMGPTCATRAARSAAIQRAGLLTVVGVAGAVSPRLRTGDVVVATQVRGPQGVVHCAGAPLMAGALSRAGFRVHLGPIASADHVVTGSERAAVAADGTLCVDMESDWVLARASTPFVSAVRVVADVATAPLSHPGTLGRMWTALRNLPGLCPTLTAWGRAAAEREVVLAAPRSFCAGVERAIEIVDRALDQRGAPVYVRKQIVHNLYVVKDLEARGAVFVDDLDQVPAGATVVFSAHGVAPDVREAAEARGLDVIDATCPLVSKVHADVRRYADSGDTVIFIGHADHEETVGTMGERPGRTVLVSDTDQAATVEVPDPDRVSYQVQTTLAAGDVAGIVSVLRERFPHLRAPASDGICYATTNRQRALQTVAVDVDLMLVLGSANSSNSNRLVELATRLGRPAHLIDDASDIELEWLRGASVIGISAGASAPQILVDDAVTALGGLGPVRVTERSVTTEDVRFNVPRKVRTP